MITMTLVDVVTVRGAHVWAAADVSPRAFFEQKPRPEVRILGGVDGSYNSTGVSAVARRRRR